MVVRGWRGTPEPSGEWCVGTGGVLLIPIWHKRGTFQERGTFLWVETSVGAYNLEEAMEKPWSDLLAIHRRMCTSAWPARAGWRFWIIWKQGMKSLLVGNVYDLCRVKTVMTAVLTVKSSMDPHTISWNFWMIWSDELFTMGNYEWVGNP